MLITRFVISLLFSIIAASVSWASQYRAAVTVLDSRTGEPIEFAVVRLSQNAGDVAGGLTDGAGVYVARLGAGEWNLEVSSTGYKLFTRAVNI